MKVRDFTAAALTAKPLPLWRLRRAQTTPAWPA
jgi:hypothetical protein